MTATQLALGIFFGFGGLEVFKAVVATAYESHKRNEAKQAMHELADDFIDKMHKDLMADREAQAKKKTVKKAPARKSAVKKGGKK